MQPHIIIISHGSRKEEANTAFIKLVEKAASRSLTATVSGAFLSSFANPSIEEEAAKAVNSSKKMIFLLPYLLAAGSHTAKDLPQITGDLQNKYPDCTFKLLPCLEGEPLLEDIIYEIIARNTTDEKELPMRGAKIEELSHRIIDRRLSLCSLSEQEKTVARRIIHATADFSFAETLDFHPEAVSRAIEAIKSGAPIICDVNMLKNGITRAVNSEKICLISDEQVIDLAKQDGCTRAAAAFKILGEKLNGALIAVGNAPTALWQLMEMDVTPAAVVGLPVGFVGARESKNALIDSKFIHIANTSPRGGSPAAAAAVNALALLAKKGNS